MLCLYYVVNLKVKRHQEIEYVNNLIRKEAEEQEEEKELAPIATTTNTAAEEAVTTTNELSKVTRPLQQKQETVSSKSILGS